MVRGVVVSSYDHAVNSIGLRSAIGQTGTAIASGRLIALGYSSDMRQHGAANRLARITAPVNDAGAHLIICLSLYWSAKKRPAQNSSPHVRVSESDHPRLKILQTLRFRCDAPN